MRRECVPEGLAYDLAALRFLSEGMPSERLTKLLLDFHGSVVRFREELERLSHAEIRFRAHRLASSAWAVGVNELGASAAWLDAALASFPSAEDAASALSSFRDVLLVAERDLEPTSAVKAVYSTPL